MGLLHKNLILAGIASVAMVGFLSSSGASALDGFSFSDIVNQQQAQREQLLSYLINPFGTSTACESTNPDSTISCNESLFPELLYNRIADGTKLYGHDGKGVIFTDTEQLVGNNPQLRTANRGDTLNFSAKFEMERYYDDAKTMPITRIELAIGFSEGLVLSENSVSLRINNQLIPAGEYSTDSFDFDEDQQLQYGITGATVFNVPLYNGAFIYPENSTIELLYSATVGENAAGEVYGRTAYAVSYINGGSEDTDWSTEEDLFSDNYQATAMLDGNIVIKRIDGDGSPISGAKYTVDGVKANIEDETDNTYVYDENGAVSEFITNDEGMVVIKGVPFDTYTAREISSTDGEEPIAAFVTQNIAREMEKTEYGKTRFVGPYQNQESIDYTDIIRVFDDGLMGVNSIDIFKQLLSEEELAEVFGYDDLSDIATYDPETDSYIGSILIGEKIKKVDNSYVLGEHDGAIVVPYDPSTNSYRTAYKLSDVWEGDLQLRINGDGTASFGINVDEPIGNVGTLILNEKTGCYEAERQGFCRDGDNYVAKVEQSGYGYWYLIARPTSTSGLYSADYDFYYYVVEELDNNTIRVGSYAPITHLEESDTYYIAPATSGVGLRKLTVSKQNIMSSVFYFQGKSTNSIPESIPINPQTSDAIIKAIIIAGIGLAPIFIFRKQISKRAN